MKILVSLLSFNCPLILVGQFIANTDPTPGVYDTVLANGVFVVNVGAGVTVNDGIYAFENSTVNMTGGTSAGLFDFESSTINVIGGTVTVEGAFDNSTFNISGGDVTLFAAFHNSTINVWASDFGAGLGAGSYSLGALDAFDAESNYAFLDLTYGTAARRISCSLPVRGTTTPGVAA